MTDANDNGGPAFPIYEPRTDDMGGFLGVYCAQRGMTLHDWFAGRATEEDIANFIPITQGTTAPLMVKLGIIKSEEPEPGEAVYYAGDYARLRAWARYQYADTMIAEKRRREQKR